MCVVIGLQSTGEANTTQLREEQNSDDFDDFVSAPKLELRNLIQNHVFNVRDIAAAQWDDRRLDKLLVQVRASACCHMALHSG